MNISQFPTYWATVCCRYRVVFLSPHVKRKKFNAAFQALHTRATRIFQHIYLMYANDLAVLNEGTINHYNDPLKKN